MAKVKHRKIDPAYEIHMALYQAITGPDEEDKIFKNVSPDFFDMVVIDECHRGSAADDSAWREILDYFSSTIQLGMTATPKETKYVSNLTYFGELVYTYSLKQGIADGFLAPYKVVRIDIDKDIHGWTPPPGMTDDLGQHIENRTYNLDIKNPHVGELVDDDPDKLLKTYAKQHKEIAGLRDQLKAILAEALSNGGLQKNDQFDHRTH